MRSNMIDRYKATIEYWTENLAGSASSYWFNILLAVAGGGLYSFGVWPSPILLAIFGVVSPLIYTLCLYHAMGHVLGNVKGHTPLFGSLPMARMSNRFLVIDMVIIVGVAVLIHLNILNYLLVRLLQTVVFPLLMLYLLRLLLLHVQSDTPGDQE